MLYVLLCLTGLLVAALTLGPLSHIALSGFGTINLVVVTVWAFVWFGNIETAFRWAIILGIILDFVSFLPFGFWTVLLLFLTYISNQLKSRFFELSSIFQASIVLVIQLVIWELVLAIIAKQLLVSTVVFSIFYSLIFGMLVYYVFAIRYKLLQRWLGRRL